MLELKLSSSELFDEETYQFIHVPNKTMYLEHSLRSLSKWESKWKKPYLHTENKTPEEYIDYIKCMCLNPGDFDDDVYGYLTSNEYGLIDDYLRDPYTATTIKNDDSKKSGEIVTAEIIYWWMTENSIPFECDTWNLNKLMTLITVCSIKAKPGKKMSKRETLAQYRALNAARTKG